MEENIYSKICVKCGKEFISKGKAPAGICEDCNKEEKLKYATTYLGQWIVEQNDYFRVIKEILEGRKTPIYNIETLDGLFLGEIKWYGAWRKFCFFPDLETIWDNKCLSLVVDFLDEVNKEWRESRR